MLNQTAEAGEVLVTLQLDDKARGSARHQSLADFKSLRTARLAVEFPVNFTAAGAAKWLWHARFAQPTTNGFADARAEHTQVGFPAPCLREVLSARRIRAKPTCSRC